MVKLNRRGFLMGCSAAIAALAGSRITNLAFAAPGAASNPEFPGTLVVVFLRGGWDALNVVPVIGGADRGIYETLRPNIKIPVGGAGSALNLNGQFGLHPAMASLYEMYQQQKMAIVHAAGLTSDTRSHFDAQQFIELGTPGAKSSSTGWITRHLQSAPYGPTSAVFPALSTGGGQAMSLAGFNGAVAMNTPGEFNLDGWSQYVSGQRTALRTFYAGAGFLDAAARETLDTIDLIESTAPGDYAPANGAQYPSTSFSDNLQSIAQLIKMDLGLNVATVDLGGWDTHEHQGNTPTAGDQLGGYFGSQLLKPMSDALKAFMVDLDGSCPNWANRTTVVVMSEFGRRVAQNENDGTDHGHGSVMLVLGGGIRGGWVYGNWPGLANDQLYDRSDLKVTTDYRQVLTEILQYRLNNANSGTIFPGFTPTAPLGIARDPATINPPPIPGTYTNRVYIPMMRKQGC